MSWPGHRGEEGVPGFPPGTTEPGGFIVTFIVEGTNGELRTNTRFVGADKKDKALDFLNSKRKVIGSGFPIPILQVGEWEDFIIRGMVIHDRKKLVIDIIKEYGRIAFRGRKNAKKII